MKKYHVMAFLKLMVLAVALLLSPVSASHVYAYGSVGDACGTDDSCNGSPGTCNGNCKCTSGHCTLNTPEMEDYMAVAFVLAASGLIYYIRSRNAVKA